MYRIQRRHISSADAEHRKVLLGPITKYSPEMSHISEKDEPFSLSVSLFASPTIYRDRRQHWKSDDDKTVPIFCPDDDDDCDSYDDDGKEKSPFFFLVCPPYTETPLSLHLFHSHKLFCPLTQFGRTISLFLAPSSKLRREFTLTILNKALSMPFLVSSF